MTLARGIEVGLDAQVCIASESGTYPNIATAALTDAIKFTKVKITPNQERKQAAEFRKNRSHNTSERYTGRRSASFEIEMEARGGGTGGSAPDSVDLLTDFFGSAVVNTATDVSIADSATAFDVTTIGNITEKTFIGWLNSAGDLEARFVDDITVNKVTVDPGFSAAPAVGDAILASYNLTLATQTLTNSFTTYVKTTYGAAFAKGCKISTMKISFDGDSVKLAFTGEAADYGYTVQDELVWPVKANYAFSQNGATGDETAIDGTHKTFKLSVAGDTAEDCTLAGTEATWLAIVTYLNATAIPALSNPNNAAAVAELIGSGSGTGMYIRPATTGNGKDVLVTAGSSNDCSVVLEMGEANGGYELDADELKVDDSYKHSVDAHITINSETHIITANDNDNDILTVTRASAGSSAADHEIGDDIDPYYPSSETFVDVQPMAGIDGGAFLDSETSAGDVLTAEITIDEKTTMFGKQLGKAVADAFARTGVREVTVSTSLYATNQNLWLRGKADKFERMSALFQGGDIAGNTLAAYCPRLEAKNPDYDPGQDEENTLEVEFDALSALAAGGDEITIAFL